tara:strand:- start:5534 stop:5809 length:276 start_codon:yes stop_codon:yes gene_type:complete
MTLHRDSYSRFDSDANGVMTPSFMYVSKDCRDIGLPALHEAKAEIENMPFPSNEQPLTALDLHYLIYEQPHEECGSSHGSFEYRNGASGLV